MTKKMQTAESRSVEQLQSQLAQLDVDRKTLEAALKQRRSVELAAFSEEIRGAIAARGYCLEEVIALLTRGRKGSPAQGSAVGYTRFVDPDNPKNTYTRGPVPQWLRQKMEAAGYDPNDRKQRDDFKSSHLKSAG